MNPKRPGSFPEAHPLVRAILTWQRTSEGEWVLKDKLSGSLFGDTGESSLGELASHGDRSLVATKLTSLGKKLASKPAQFWTAFIDGGARGNPGPAGFGVAVRDESGAAIADLSEYLGHQTNNYAEYSGLLAALRYALEHRCRALEVVSDSELMVKQMNGVYKVKHPVLKELHGEAQGMVKRLDWFKIRHVLRGENRVADGLANAAMDKGMKR